NFGIRVYRNGAMAPVYEDVNLSFAFSPAQLHVMSNGGTNGLTGRLDEFRMWAQARTPAQINANYQNEILGRLEVRRPAAIAHNGADNIGAQTVGVPAVLDYTLANIGSTGLLMSNPAISSTGAS